MEDNRRRFIDLIRTSSFEDKVVQAMIRVPRHLFVPEQKRHLAYHDIPVPIGDGQTISQPYIVAMAMDALKLKNSDSVLEIGTGSGYQAAILGEIVSKVITVERIKSLADSAKLRLVRLGYENIEVRFTTETLGCPEEAPYDAIVVSAGSPKLPESLTEQLEKDGRMIIPIGSARVQELIKITRSRKGYSFENLGKCRFVPLIGTEAWSEKGQEYM